MLDDPANAACPPLLTANGHCVSLDISTSVETSKALEGLKMQYGSTLACCTDQYESVKESYPEAPWMMTLLLPKRNFKEEH